MQPWDGKDSFHLFCGSLALALLLGPALPHLVAAFRQDSGLAYSEYGAACAIVLVLWSGLRYCIGIVRDTPYYVT